MRAHGSQRDFRHAVAMDDGSYGLCWLIKLNDDLQLGAAMMPRAAHD